MRVLRIAAVLLSVLAVGMTAQGIPSGSWRTVVVPGQHLDRMPKMFGEVLLDLKVEGEKLTGTATMGDGRGYPGSAPIQDGQLEGNQFSFTWTGTSASWGGACLCSSYPHLTFSGTIDGDQMKLSMDGAYKMELQGARLPPK